MSEVFPFPGCSRLSDRHGRAADLRREPGETLHDYLVRIGHAREIEIERLNRIVLSQEQTIAAEQRKSSHRLRGLVLVEAALAIPASCVLMLGTDLPMAARLLMLGLAPLMFLAAGLAFLRHAAAAERVAPRFLPRRRS